MPADGLVAGTILWLDERRWLGPVRGGLALALFAVPAGADFSLLANRGWYALAVLAALAFGVIELHHARLQGTAFDRLMERISSIQGSFAGGIDGIRLQLAASRSRKLAHDTALHLVAGLLRRVRDYAQVVYDGGAGVRLRATLLVPVGPHEGEASALCVWAYDDSHRDRAHTCIPLRAGGEMVAGAPRAYLLREVDVLHDVHEVEGPPRSARRPYRAILSVPLDARDPATGSPLGVVCIDADRVGFFDSGVAVGRIHPLIAPALNAIGLVLALRNRSQPYAFPD